MPIVALPAHYNGERICLDEPFDLQPNTKLIVTILPDEKSANEHDQWILLSSQRLNDAYGDNELEYSLQMVKEENPDYEAE